MPAEDQNPQIPARLERRLVPSIAAIGQRSQLPAWSLSLLLHATMFTLVATLWTSKPHGTGGQPGRPMGIAVVTEHAGDQNYFLVNDDQTSSDGQSSPASNDQSDASNAINPLSGLPSIEEAGAAQAEMLSGLLPDLNMGSGTSGASGDLGLGKGGSGLSTGGQGGTVRAEYFGVQGEGHRFVYVIDRSDSMNGFEGKPFRRAKDELRKSLSSLGPTHQFQVVFYNDTPLPYGGLAGRGPQLLHGDDSSKELASRFVDQIHAIGGTNHVDALRMALAMGPDVLFFLTDGDFPQPPANAIENILTRASRTGTTIHCIQFGEGNRSAGSRWISHLAESSGGKFQYVDVSQF